MDWLQDLNPAQWKAVKAIEGPVLVLAGPGSGKTRVLTCRVAYLVREHDVPPWHILAVTFTNRAAREMKERLESLLSEGPSHQLTLGTFHATCARILRREAKYTPLSRDYVIYDSDDQLAIIGQALEELNLDEKQYRPRPLHSTISHAKNDLINPDEYQPRTYWQEVAHRVYLKYQKILGDNDARDFDDLLMDTVHLYREHDEILARYQERYQYILVDEWQDTNMAQYELVKLLGGRYRNVFVVGDPDQSIYRFRGADYRNVHRFERDYPEARVILLERNYRSTQTVLDVANAVIAPSPNRHPKVLYTEEGTGSPIVVKELYDEDEEAQFVVEEIARLTLEGHNPGDCAVMYRTNAQSRALEDAFIRRGLPYHLVGATRFYARREIKDLLAYLHIIHNPYDGISLERVLNVPPRGIGPKTRQALERWRMLEGLATYDALQLLGDQEIEAPLSTRARHVLADFGALWGELVNARTSLPLPQLFNLVLERTGYQAYIHADEERGEERWANVMELRSVAQAYGDLPPEEGLATFLQEVALVSGVDNLEEQEEAPTLLTLHMAKGLEFPVVFIVGMEEGLLPHSRSLDDPEQLEEERRLCYVGITRAKERLYLLYTFRRAFWGDSDVRIPSRFLSDIPSELVEERREDQESRRGQGQTHWEEAKKPVAAQFRSGDRVHHPTFGDGIVVESEISGGEEEVTVAFEEVGVKRLLVSFANLERMS
ncbi:MAG: UvrD-helicase domain-containing protein [Chloroflexota bacterium]|nr:UvrD-helicase domain-containing protein [Chloroflexota bacterium]